MHQQAVGCDQQHLEGNEKVEQVTGQEGDVEAHQLEQEQGVELSVTLVGAADGIQVAEQGQNGGHDQHQRGQPVQNQDNPERWLPVAKSINAVTAVVCQHQKDYGRDQDQHGGCQCQSPAQRDGGIAHQCLQNAAKQRNQNRSGKPMVHLPVTSSSSCSGAGDL